ncbi:unnamed protein product [Symbiodinium sp. CCMP2456]|nr:unnamed protein product [Symbiodinium sp. CCMP2456]
MGTWTDLDCCATEAGDNTDQGACRRTVPSLTGLADAEEPMRTFDCDVDVVDGEPMKENPDALGGDLRGAQFVTESLIVRREPRGFHSRLEQSAHLALDDEIARAVPLPTTLRAFGYLWRLRPNKMSQDELLKLWQYSKKANSFDAFVSHTWWTPGYQKFISLLLRSYWHYAVVAMIATSVVIMIMYRLDILPMPLRFASPFRLFPKTVPCGPWATLFAFIISLFALLCAPFLPCQSFDIFFDAACIHQTDPVMRERGIYGIGGYLTVSKELRILWSVPYLTRLWCIFELAGYRRANPKGKIVFQPLKVERDFCVLWACVYLFSCVFHIMNTGSALRGLFVISALLAVSALIPSVHAIRKGFQEQEHSLQGMANFDLELVSCSSDFDKQFILGAVSQWYGSADAFTQYVRGPLRDELVQVVAEMQAPVSYCLLSCSPLAGIYADVLGALWLGGAPSQVMLAYLMGEMLSTLLLVMAQFKILFILAKYYTQPRFGSRTMDYVQTCGVSLVFLMPVAVSWPKNQAFYAFGVPGAAAVLVVSVVLFIAIFFRDFKRLWSCFRAWP